jgi:hypothetical protein
VEQGKALEVPNDETSNLIYQKIINGNTSELPSPVETIEKNKKNILYLPPLFFATNSTDTNTMKRIIGLYYYTNGKYNKIKNWDYFSTLSTITYSRIFSLIEKMGYTGKIKLNLFCCRSFGHMNYVKRVKPTDRLFYGVSPDESLYQGSPELFRPKKTAIIKQPNINGDWLQVFAKRVDFDIHSFFKTAWKGALLNIKYQGCGVNILDFYGIESKSKATSMVVCLPIKGMSIFTFIDILNEKLNETSIQYVVVRFKIDVLEQWLHNIRFSVNVAVFVKLYKKHIHDGKESDVGHFVSFYFGFERENGEIYLVDPQSSLIQKFNGNIESIYGQLEAFDSIFYIQHTTVNVFQTIPIESFYLRERSNTISF